MTTNLKIKDKTYDLEDTFSRVRLNVLVYMTKRVGVTMKSIVGGLEQMNTSMQAAKTARDAGDPDAPSEVLAQLEVLSTPEGLDAFRGLVWLSKTHAGERGPDGQFLSLDDANDDIGITDFAFVDGEADPTVLEAAEADLRSSSKTSSVMSTTTS